MNSEYRYLDNITYQGTCKWFNQSLKYGFISYFVPDKKYRLRESSIFFHCSDLLCDFIASGDKVIFRIVKSISPYVKNNHFFYKFKAVLITKFNNSIIHHVNDNYIDFSFFPKSDIFNSLCIYDLPLIK